MLSTLTLGGGFIPPALDELACALPGCGRLLAAASGRLPLCHPRMSACSPCPLSWQSGRAGARANPELASAALSTLVGDLIFPLPVVAASFVVRLPP